MSSLWKTVIEEGKDCTFQQKNVYSPYMEECSPVLNQEQSGKDCLYINGMYRYEEILAPVFIQKEKTRINDTVRQALFDILVHYLADSDIRSEETRQGILAAYVKDELQRGSYGMRAKDFYEQLTRKEQVVIGYDFLRQEESVSSLLFFQKVLQQFYRNARVYRLKKQPKNLLVYIGQEKNEQLENRLLGIEELFLPIGYKIRYFYTEHFGVMGAEETMRLGDIEVF